MHKKITEWVIPLSCILLQYRALFSSYGLLALLLVLVLFIVNYGYFKLDKGLFFLGVIIAIQEIVATILLGRNISAFFSNIANVFIIILITSVGLFDLNKEKIIRNLKIVGFISTIIVIIQTVGYLFFKIPISSIMILPQGTEVMHYWTINNIRACAFFTEPQTFCSSILPLIIICLNRKEYRFALFLSVGVLFTGSSLGIATVALSWLLLMLKSNASNSTKTLTLGLLGVGMVSFNILPMFFSARNKIGTVFNDFSLYINLSMTNSHSYSNYLRLIKGWVTFFELPIKEKISGLTINGLSFYLNEWSAVFSWSSQWDSNARMSAYFSSAAGVFIECGLIVGIIYYIFIIKKIHDNTDIAKYILIFMIVQSLMTQFFFNGLFAYYILLFYIFCNRKFKVITFKFGNESR